MRGRQQASREGRRSRAAAGHLMHDVLVWVSAVLRKEEGLALHYFGSTGGVAGPVMLRGRGSKPNKKLPRSRAPAEARARRRPPPAARGGRRRGGRRRAATISTRRRLKPKKNYQKKERAKKASLCCVLHLEVLPYRMMSLFLLLSFAASAALRRAAPAACRPARQSVWLGAAVPAGGGNDEWTTKQEVQRRRRRRESGIMMIDWCLLLLGPTHGGRAGIGTYSYYAARLMTERDAPPAGPPAAAAHPPAPSHLVPPSASSSSGLRHDRRAPTASSPLFSPGALRRHAWAPAVRLQPRARPTATASVFRAAADDHPPQTGGGAAAAAVVRGGGSLGLNNSLLLPSGGGRPAPARRACVRAAAGRAAGRRGRRPTKCCWLLHSNNCPAGVSSGGPPGPIEQFRDDANNDPLGGSRAFSCVGDWRQITAWCPIVRCACNEAASKCPSRGQADDRSCRCA